MGSPGPAHQMIGVGRNDSINTIRGGVMGEKPGLQAQYNARMMGQDIILLRLRFLEGEVKKLNERIALLKALLEGDV